LIQSRNKSQNKRLSAEFLRGETVNKIFEFNKTSASAKGLDLLINNPSDLFQTAFSYF
jgi:hypothetical protein